MEWWRCGGWLGDERCSAAVIGPELYLVPGSLLDVGEVDVRHLGNHCLLSSMLIDMFVIFKKIVGVEEKPFLVHMAAFAKILDVPVHDLG